MTRCGHSAQAKRARPPNLHTCPCVIDAPLTPPPPSQQAAASGDKGRAIQHQAIGPGGRRESMTRLTIAPAALAFRRRLLSRPVPPRILHAVSGWCEYHPTLLQGVKGAIELTRRAAAPRTIALLKERLVLGASRLHVGRQSGGYRDKSYEGKTHVALPSWRASPSKRLAGHRRFTMRGP